MKPAPTFNGRKCRLGHTLRYRSGQECVACSRAKATAQRLAMPPPRAPHPTARHESDDAKRSRTSWQRIRSSRGALTHIAALLGIRVNSPQKWTVIPLEHVFLISAVYRVPPEDLRPDFFRTDPLRRSAFATAAAPKAVDKTAASHRLGYRDPIGPLTAS